MNSQEQPQATPPWDAIRAEYGDTLQQARVRQRRSCSGCGVKTTATSGMCMDCQPSLLEPVSTAFTRGETEQLGPEDPWPGDFF